MSKTQTNTFDRTFWKIFATFFVVICILLFFPYWLTQFHLLSWGFSDKPGEIGDAIGGTLGPFVAIAAAILTFLAFWVQYKANLQQREQFEKQLVEQRSQFDIQLKQQKSDSLTQENIGRIDRFETRFFELIKLHRENVNEIKLKNGAIQGRSAFVYFFEEFRFTYSHLKRFITHESSSEWFPKDAGFERDNEQAITNLAYLIYFIGVGTNSDPLLRSYSRNVCSDFFLNLVIAKYKQIQQTYTTERLAILKRNKNRSTKTVVGDIAVYPKLAVMVEGIGQLTLTARYKPFSGHMSNLGHYYRHLFQTVKFVDQFDPSVLTGDDKIKYVKNLRAQLSTHEQLLLYYNCLSKFGRAWNDVECNFIVKYKMIKNIPLPLAGFGITPEIKYSSAIQELRKNGEELFEWTE